MDSNSEMASAMNQQRLALLKVALVAIDKWDETYRRDKTHDTSDEFSYRARQLRRQIMKEIELLLTFVRPVDQLAFLRRSLHANTTNRVPATNPETSRLRSTDP
jgi:hypothetical protein